ncbi:MAG: DUF3768 domain-containing protein [Cyanobacteria bacterium J06649_11]
MNTRTEKIAELNDEFRKSTNPGLFFYLTRGIQVLPPNDRAAIIGLVQTFNDFTEDNDPYGEHDFGAFYHNEERIFWKIDYYDKDMRQGSEDPADPDVTQRVMTIMLAHEY